MPEPVWGGSLRRNSLRTESRGGVNKGKGERVFLASGTVGAKASGGGSMVHLQNQGQVGVAGVQGKAGENCLPWDPREGYSQIVQGFGGYRKAFGIYLESKVESSQGTGLCLNLLLREFRKKIFKYRKHSTQLL